MDHLCYLYFVIVSWSTSGLRVRLERHGTGLSPPVKYFTDRSMAVLLLWIISDISVLFCYTFACVCLLMYCGHLLGKGWPLCSRLWCPIVKLSLSHWYPGSSVVLDRFVSWSLPSFLLLSIWHSLLIRIDKFYYGQTSIFMSIYHKSQFWNEIKYPMMYHLGNWAIYRKP